MALEPPVNPQLLVAPEVAAPKEVIQQQVVSQDYLVLRVAVYGLIISIVMSIIGVVTLAYLNKELPDGVLAMGSAAVGALSTMLVRPSISA
jgi:uncharacterized integral membrane protein